MQTDKMGIITANANQIENISGFGRNKSLQEIDEMAVKIQEHDPRVHQMNVSQETLNRRFLELTELKYVLRETAFFFQQVARQDSTAGGSVEVEAPLIDTEAARPTGEGFHSAQTTLG
jgi:V-type H+-transporting ATPase subunit a